MKKRFLIGMVFGLAMLAVTIFVHKANAGVVVFDNKDICLRGGTGDVTCWIGQDILNNESVAGVKTSILTYYKLPVQINIDLGLIGKTAVSNMNDLDCLFGFGVTLPETLKLEWHGEWLLDCGIGYSPDFIVGPERVILFGGIKKNF